VIKRIYTCDIYHEGWNWVEKSDAAWRVELCGDLCEQVKHGSPLKVVATYGCPTSV
jgi:hypothetical protein